MTNATPEPPGICIGTDVPIQIPLPSTCHANTEYLYRPSCYPASSSANHSNDLTTNSDDNQYHARTDVNIQLPSLTQVDKYFKLQFTRSLISGFCHLQLKVRSLLALERELKQVLTIPSP
ncbi:hypothetical protein AVEN_214161-1 [Araneus ventricosus]|uniref:Uncharacterized protein n=1 Tax=Araneus ventricosus TaxID=182803 RepID=A0A4Y2NY14_ARAVE|nr:hypothetical protein AVEN_119874-1 [Araneus ventricosus]GBN44387.1 hypothetical protein AVEN_171689-1 [Araneus ventricosus]GBN44410.1 hypothetical protein AVEN_211346-1 [Araneus ventricosus]GBN44418.1 hypothetical protein AVEN_214161-1 [Araneus ventricosus]